jgi:hypothetical protein
MHRRQMQGLSRTDSNQLCSELHKRWRTRSSSWEFFCVCVVDFHVSFSQCGQDANFCLDSSAVCGVCPSGSICELKFGAMRRGNERSFLLLLFVEQPFKKKAASLQSFDSHLQSQHEAQRWRPVLLQLQLFVDRIE